MYTSPVETGVNGTIRFGFPAVFVGREIDDARLVLENGRVVAAEAAGGEDYLRSLLELDEGASGVGEIAFGLNYEIDRFTRNILFDEKIGGTMHMALGMGFEALGGLNRSALHLDLICDLRREGEVYADGELVVAQRAVPTRDPAVRACRTCSIAATNGWPTCSSASAPVFGRAISSPRVVDALAAPLRELYRKVLEAGAQPLPRIALEPLTENLLKFGNDEQLDWVNPARVDDIEASMSGSPSRPRANTKRLSNVDPARQARYDRSAEPLRNRYLERARRRRAPLGVECLSDRGGGAGRLMSLHRVRGLRLRRSVPRRSRSGRAVAGVRRAAGPSCRVSRDEAGVSNRHGRNRPEARHRGQDLDCLEGAGELPRRRDLHGARRVQR